MVEYAFKMYICYDKLALWREDPVCIEAKMKV